MEGASDIMKPASLGVAILTVPLLANQTRLITREKSSGALYAEGLANAYDSTTRRYRRHKGDRGAHCH